MTEAGGASLLRATGLRKEYGKEAGLVRAVDGIDLDVVAGETVAVMGPSGCGKSTLLHLLGGLDRPTGGEIRLAGKRIDQIGEKALARMRRDAIGFVFQAFHDRPDARAGPPRSDRSALPANPKGHSWPGRDRHRLPAQ
jgi:ABC-type lipoprotein export system ATPase subunit